MKNKTLNPVAKARRNGARIRKENLNKWEKLGHTKMYLNASARLLCGNAEDNLLDELIDGDTIYIDVKYASKTKNVQKRVVRRIVEKRQAQNMHRIFGHSCDLHCRHMARYYSNRCANIIFSLTA